MAVEALLARFPKTRPPLPAAFQAIYDRQYLENRSGATRASGLTQKVEAWMHRQVAADGARGPTLELGAGTLNQLAFEEPRDRDQGGAYDIVEPFGALYQASPDLGRVRDVFADIREVPSARRYARITSVATLEHVCDLPFALARAALLLTDGGSFRAAIPSEGGLLWRLGWMATTGLEFRLRHGLDYGVMMRHEHVNTAAEIEIMAHALFEDVEIRALGLGRQLSLYRFISARRPRRDVALAWMARFA